MSTPVRDRAALAGLLPLAALVLAACGSGGGNGAAGSGAGAVAVTAGNRSCEVSRLELPAGRHTFTVTNTGSRTTEFEILAEGERIVGEVENIAPGVARPLLVELGAGTYQAACRPGMVGTGVRQRLTVTGTSARLSDDQKLQAAVAGYTDYVRTQVATLQQRTREFAAAVRAGDVGTAQARYPVARSSYERIEPVAESFGDLDPRIDARENDVEEGDTWTGFHVLEKTLWTGGDLAAAGPVVDRLVHDVDELATRVGTLHLAPLDLANGALGLLDEVATRKITGEEDRYSHTDLFDIAANLEGSRQAVQSLRPVIAERRPELATRLDQQFAAATAELDQYRRGDGWALWTDLTQDQLRTLSDAVDALAAAVSQVPAAVAAR